MRSGAHVDPLTRQFPAFQSTGRIINVEYFRNIPHKGYDSCIILKKKKTNSEPYKQSSDLSKDVNTDK